MKTAFERLVAARPAAVGEPVDEALLDRITATEPHRRRRPRLAIGIAFAAVLVVAGGMAFALQDNTQKPPEISVVAHVRKALSEKNYVVRNTYPVRNGQKVEATDWSDAVTGRWRSSTMHDGARTDILATGRSVTVVSYRDRAWWQYQSTPQPQPTGGIKLDSPPNTPERIMAALTDGSFRVEEGKQPTINGHRTIQLSSTRAHPVLGSFTIWVDAISYLPVRIRGKGDGKILVVGSDIEWLPRTAANLANLELAIPPGFRHVDKAIEPKSPANGGVG